MKKPLTIETLIQEAKTFSHRSTFQNNNELFGFSDGKTVGTFIEHAFQRSLKQKYTFIQGNSAHGIDFPELLVDIKVTSIRQPQSSCPYESARQKIYGLGYGLLIFIYEKIDNLVEQSSSLKILHTIFVDKSKTADYQTTIGIQSILENNGNRDDILAFFEDRHLPIDITEANRLASEILTKPPEIGYLTISNALQWRLQYSRVIEKAGTILGIVRA